MQRVDLCGIISKINNEMHCNSSAFWKFINGKRKNFNLPITMKYNDVTSNSAATTVNLFADFFFICIQPES